MKHTWKTMVALLLVLALAFSLTAPAWAAESGPESDAQGQTEIVTEEESLAAQSEDTEEESTAAQSGDTGEESLAAQSGDTEEEGLAAQSGDSDPSGLSDQEGGDVSGGELPPVSADLDLIEPDEAFVCLDQDRVEELWQQPQAPAYFVSKNPNVVSVQENGDKLVMRGVSVGKTVVEMRRQADNSLLDKLVVYGYRPTTVTQASGSRAKPGDLTTTNAASSTRTYKLTCQKAHDDEPYGSYLRHHGCTICCVSGVSQAYGSSPITVDWMLTGGMEEIAVRNGKGLQDDTLGYYGMQKVLEYAGISSKIYNWKNHKTASMEAAKLEMVTALSESRPVLIFVDSNTWNGIGPLCGGLHCLTLVGIDEDGYLEMINSSYPQKINNFSNKIVQLTPGELLEHFVRHSSMDRTKEDDFYFTKAGGLHTFLEVTCDTATMPQRTSIKDISGSLEKTKYTYSGVAFTPKVTLGSLTENVDYKVRYADNINAGTSVVTVAGMGDYCGMQKLKFTIKQISGKITCSDITVSRQDQDQTVKLNASARGNAKITYKSDNDNVKVNSSGEVTVKGGYVGTATITLKSAKTTNCKAASAKVKVTVADDGQGGVTSPAVTLKSVKASKGGKATVKWSKVSGVAGYQVQYKGNGKTKTVKVKKAKSKSVKIKGLKKGKTYKVCVRSYTKTDSGTVYSKWSKKIKVKAK